MSKKLSLGKGLIKALQEALEHTKTQKPYCPSNKNKVETPKSVYSRKKKHRPDWSKE